MFTTCRQQVGRLSPTQQVREEMLPTSRVVSCRVVSRDWRSNGNWANLSAAGVHYVISLLWHSVISMNSLCIVYKLLYLLFLYCYNCLLLTWRTMCALQSFQSTYANMERANQSFTHAMNATYRISTLPQVYNITPCIHANASFSNLLLFSYNFCIFLTFVTFIHLGRQFWVGSIFL